MIRRQFNALLKRKLASFPIVTLLGPRQCGKTTFIRSTLNDWSYIDLEKPSEHTALSQDPEHRIQHLGGRVIFDEAQRVPELFPVLRSRVDENRKKNGQYVLLGSASPTLIKRISESLAGRTTFLEMPPFQWPEVKDHAPKQTLETLWFRGGFPNAFLEKDSAVRMDWFDAYTRNFIERDLAALGIEVTGPQMRKLWTMLAHVHGGLWNASPLAASLGVSPHTVNRYTDILEQTFLVRKLQPYFANVGKRLTKSPKTYLRDTGLLHYFLGIHSPEVLSTHPGRGAGWEGFVIEHLITAYQLRIPGAQPFFWRTAAGAEVDLLIQNGDRLIPFEIKRHTAPTAADVRSLFVCMDDLKISKGYVLSAGRTEYSLGQNVVVLPAEELLADPDRIKHL